MNRKPSPDPGAAAPLRAFADAESPARSLEAGGLSAEAARRQAELVALCGRRLIEAGERPEAPARGLFVPGRIEVLGKHTDYCGGRSLLAATERGFAFVAVPGADETLHLTDARLGEETSFPLGAQLEPVRGHWANYPMTVARRVARNFPGSGVGGRIAFASSLPPAAGLSTSSALMIGTFQVLASFNRLTERESFRRNLPDIEALASYLASVENGSSYGDLEGDRGVGTHGGSEDHTAILASVAGRLAVYSFGPARLERRIALPEGWRLAVASSGIAAEKTGAAMERYNRASRLARALVEIWNRAAEGEGAPHLAAICGARPGNAARLRELVERGTPVDSDRRDLLDRLEHFLEESDRILPAAVSALEGGDLEEFGRHVDRSQDLGARLLRNQVPETVFLAAEARRLAAEAASAFGAGFGGSVWALVPATGTERFLESWKEAYAERYPGLAGSASFFSTTAATAAFELRP